jgi:MFS family permease
MAGLLHHLSELWPRLRQSAAHLTSGGSWAESFPKSTQHNLRWFWFDGLFAAASENIVLTYLTLFVLALGATRAQIGAMSALASLSAALVLLPGAALAERSGRRKLIVVISGGWLARLMVLGLVFAPVLFGDSGAIYVAIGLSVARDLFNNLPLPAWVSLTADIVPLSWRGRYFASRNIVMGIAGMVIILLGGELITRMGKPIGYQLALGIAFILGIVSTYSFSRIEEPSASSPQTKTALSPKALYRDLTSQARFFAFCSTAALWNLSLNIAGPFFTVYMVQNLKATPTMVGFFSIVTSIAALPALRFFGTLADRWGPRKVQMITGLLIPILPFSWIFATQSWHVIPINAASGFLWSGFSLASFNNLLAFTPEEQRARFSAIYQLIVTVSLAAGAALGSQIVTHWGFTGVFLGSAIGRFIAAVLFARFVPK